jgi:hypothetical protein
VNAIELALEKQRLQLEAAAQRATLAGHVDGLRPLFEAADRVSDGARWLRRHPEAVLGGVAVVAAVRPGVRRFVWLWGKRGFVAWRLWRETARELHVEQRR